VIFHILVKPGPLAPTWHVCDECTHHYPAAAYPPLLGTDGQPRTYESTTARCQQCGTLGAPAVILRSCGHCGGHWSGYQTAHDQPGGADTWYCPKHNTEEKRATARGEIR